MREYDVLVIGGGPTGSTASYILKSKYNLNVLLVDKHAFPRDKLCAGLVTKKTTDLLSEIYGENYTDFANVTNNFKLYYKHNEITDVNVDIPFNLVNRKDFDFWCFNKYKELGGETYSPLYIKTIDTANHVATFTNGETIGYKYLIGADGAFSMVRKYVDPKFRSLSFCFESYIQKENAENDLKIYFGSLKNSYFFDFYKSTYNAIGCAYFGNVKNVLPKYKSFLYDVGVTKTVDSNIKGMFIPYDYVKTPVQNHVFLAGDSSGAVDPITGEGLYFALLSAKYLADSLGKNFEDYQKAKTAYLGDFKKIQKQIDGAKKLRKYVYSKVLQPISFGLLKGRKTIFATMCDKVISTYEVPYNKFFRYYIKNHKKIKQEKKDK